MAPQLPAPLNICAAVTLFDGLFNRRRSAGLQHLADDSCGARTDSRNLGPRAIRSDEIGERPVEREDRRGGPLVPEHLLLRRLCEGQIAQIPADDSVDVCVDSGPLHRHPTHVRGGHARGGGSSRVPRARSSPIRLKPTLSTAKKTESYARTWNGMCRTWWMFNPRIHRALTQNDASQAHAILLNNKRGRNIVWLQTDGSTNGLSTPRFAMRCVHRFGFRRPSLSKVDGEPHHRRDGEEFALPVLKRLEPETR